MAEAALDRMEARVFSIDMRESVGEFFVADLAPRERSLRAAKIFGIFVLITIVVLPIPGLHIILPPVALVLGLYMAYKAWAVKRMARTGSCACPVCSSPLNFKNLELRDENKVVCPNCRNHLKIRF